MRDRMRVGGVGRLLLGLSLGSILAGGPVSANAGPPRVVRTYEAPGGEGDRQFGFGVALSGEALFIASDQSEDGPLTSGRVHVYRLAAGSGPPVDTLRAPDRSWPDRFGAAMALEDDRLLVGAPHDSEHGWDAGAVWSFRRQDGFWRLEGRLAPGGPEGGARFGASVALRKTLAVVGAPRTDGGALDTGAVHVLERRDGAWHPIQILEAPDRASGDFFGDAVACWDDWIAVGAWGDDDHGEKTGAVWLFQRTTEGWRAERKLIPEEAEARDRVGLRVAFSEGRLLVAACGADEEAGRVHVYRLEDEDWLREADLVDPKGVAGDWFGFGLAASGDLVAIGAPCAGPELNGRVILYRRTEGSWRHLGGVDGGDRVGEQPVQFGWAVATDGIRTLVGRIDDADARPVAGRAWLVETPTVSRGSRAVGTGAVRDW